MKINQDLRLNIDQLKADQKQQPLNSSRFNDYVQKQEQKLHVDGLRQLLDDIGNAGDRLARSRNFKDLAKFKTLVKKFVKETVDFGMGLKQSHSWNRFGQGRSLKTVETIDQKLMELTEELTQKEEKSIDVLGKIGEIKGLLINLYT
ncbi:YaaR family protein [Neobacillus terrae]|uniref:YaaR family protein n=1 Tax=Neobacillus terrae TaxID=3034837 RepID=UPI00140B0AC3|nr:YaaR family protein [Neobacillus terrae]NHM33471.1 YaaR family protein [Neobacillus terrae]